MSVAPLPPESVVAVVVTRYRSKELVDSLAALAKQTHPVSHLIVVDNGPAAFSQASNAGLYDNAGLLMIRAALRPEGVLAVWSAWDDRKFEHRLRHHGFEHETVHVRARLQKGGPVHTIFVGRT